MIDLQPSSRAPELLRLWLEARYAETVREIRGYPAPIPACDQHYNHLLACRRGYAQALRRLDGPVAAEADPVADPEAALEGLINFLRDVVSLSDGAARALSDHLKG